MGWFDLQGLHGTDSGHFSNQNPSLDTLKKKNLSVIYISNINLSKMSHSGGALPKITFRLPEN